MNNPSTNSPIVVPADWIDLNGHMNARFYGLVVYDAHVAFTEALGLGERYVAETGCGKVVLESHLVYEREVSEGDRLAVQSWLLALDSKRLHFFHEIQNLSKGYRAATSEQLDIHFDLAARKTCDLPVSIYRELRQRVQSLEDRVLPAGIGSRIRPPFPS